MVEKLIAYFGKRRILTHILFWVAYVLCFTLVWGSYEDTWFSYQRSFTGEIIDLPLKIIVAYLNLYVLFPRFLSKKRYAEYFGLLACVLLVAGVIQRHLSFHLFYPIYYPDSMAKGVWLFSKIAKAIVTVNSVVIFTLCVKILKSWYKEQNIRLSLETEKLEAELKFLKAQVHPHFLFNTLNNLYALTLKKSETAPEVVLKLSELMSYMLYDANAPRVRLVKEINYLENYIALEKIRYGERLELSFEATGAIAGKEIAPMLLLPFVENSFKHGASSELQAAWIQIELHLKEDELTLKVENSKNQEQKRTERDYASGIGLQNVKRRLALLYPEQHQLRIFEEENSYLAVLKLSL